MTKGFKPGDILLCKCASCLSTDVGGELVGLVLSRVDSEYYQIINRDGDIVEVVHSHKYVKTKKKKLKELFSMFLLGRG